MTRPCKDQMIPEIRVEPIVQAGLDWNLRRRQVAGRGVILSSPLAANPVPPFHPTAENPETSKAKYLLRGYREVVWGDFLYI